MNGMAICAGVGGMDLGLKLALGGEYRTVCYVEREAYAAATLVARMEDQALDCAPVWDDLATFDGRPWRGKVDVLACGLPCQPYSVAGSGRADADERALWPHFVRVVEEVEPGLLFFENVPAFLKHFGPAWERLRELGFVFAPPLLCTASESGAPHLRKRVYFLAAHPGRLGLWDQQGRSSGPDGADSAWAGAALPAPHADGGGRESEWSGWVFDSERATLRYDADGSSDGCRIRGTHWEAESPPVRVDDGPAHRVDRLRCVGNIGAPPVVYAGAFLALADAFAVGGD